MGPECFLTESLNRRDGLLTTINSKTEGGNEFLVVKIIPGNRYFRLGEESYYFNRNMPLEVRGHSGAITS